MVTRNFKDAMFLGEYRVEAYGHTYEFHIENYENTDGYARCLITDLNTEERYHAEGYIEVNGHAIITRWKKEYDYNRDNWINSTELIVEIR
jgi:hypothetical protein